ncbi:MAG: YgiQ family radical SAM protein [Bacteroidales bacterium]|nr:MAG: YgiQ family radical SAM protein [Bacteroidales bacterium]
MQKHSLTDWLPTTVKEAKIRGWSDVDVVFFSGDAYIDHPSFGTAVISRVMESMGLRVAIVPQPNWRDDLRDFKKFSKPNLFFIVSAGSMDSKVNHYTANKRLRSNDAYTPDNKSGFRPDNATTVYCNILKSLYPNTPIVIGGIEASLRRLAHYDYWEDKLMPSILESSKADILIYGMGEIPIKQVVNAFRDGNGLDDCKKLLQIGYITDKMPFDEEAIKLFSYEECRKDKRKSAQNFRIFEEQSNKYWSKKMIQPTGNRFVVINPTNEPMTTEELDWVYTLPFTRLPHPKYKGKTIPAYEMIKHSINTHRGCFGGCSFCTISAQQGKFIVSRSEDSILNEVKQVIQQPDFKGYLSDLGGPSANMYRLRGSNFEICKRCSRASCLFPKVCKNLNADHTPMLRLYHKVDALPQVKKSIISSGVRYDLLLHRTGDSRIDNSLAQYTEELIKHHVSGRLKVAPEHTSERILNAIRKPTFDTFIRFNTIFEKINKKCGLNQQLIPYFISSLPYCKVDDMTELMRETKKLNFRLEQVQDFTPTPSTLATEIYYSGIDPYSMEKVFVARSSKEKNEQKMFFFHYKKEVRNKLDKVVGRSKRENSKRK